MSRVHGVDGCPLGWAVVTIEAEGRLRPSAWLARHFGALLQEPGTIAIDIPIGLPGAITGPGRPAEQAVRPVLGPRQSSVFSIPSRAAVFAETYQEACSLALETSAPPRKVSRQAFMIFPKIREVDRWLDPSTEGRVFECHAEVAFWRLNGEAPMDTPKRVKDVPRREGLESRIALLCSKGFDRSFFESLPEGIPLIDLVDAAAIALIARRCHYGEGRPFPDPPARDEKGLRIAIWA